MWGDAETGSRADSRPASKTEKNEGGWISEGVFWDPVSAAPQSRSQSSLIRPHPVKLCLADRKPADRLTSTRSSAAGPMGDSGPLAAALSAAAVLSLSLLSLLCLRCRKKSTIIHAESQIYDPQVFQRGGSKFAVVRSKQFINLTRANQMSSIETAGESALPDDQTEEQDYENVSDLQTNSSSLEPDYVAPIGETLYVNEKSSLPDAELNPGVYGNVFPSLLITEDDDYENTEFLEQQANDEPDYVNENGEST
ncbi:uncharacterized protein LOC129373372 [Poeciliopsis prolifica]|uniref:uncharacterized protein LOC129373372 n=1 Tax=Poeciliopsis prolifica TaxID=188132 RepID=UPI002413909D|nr:uncharacterized protein LOC129373372 [Poeciliopsis prolifica]